MVDIFPFKGAHYNPDKLRDISQLVTQPYDKIGDKLQDDYYRKDDRNIVRIVKRKDGDVSPSKDKYAAAAETLKGWLADGVMTRDSSPAVYCYHQIFSHNGEERRRKGFVALLKIEEFGKGKVYPHEATHSGPKIDRLKLLTATKTHTEQIFMLYADPARKVNAILDSFCSGTPLLEAKDEDGVTHKVWRVDAPAAIKELQREMRAKEAIIADGHHRYETTLNFRNEMLKSGAKISGDRSFDKAMVTFVNMDDQGLVIFPTHRLLRDIPVSLISDMFRQLSKTFDIREYGFSHPEDEPIVRREILEDLRIDGMRAPVFGLAIAGFQAYYLLSPNKRIDRRETLDVAILHGEILEKLLGITPEHITAEQYVDFIRDAEEAVDMVRRGDPYKAVFLLNPVHISQLQTIIKKGKRLPQKTTDFYPKLISGLVLAPVEL